MRTLRHISVGRYTPRNGSTGLAPLLTGDRARQPLTGRGAQPSPTTVRASDRAIVLVLGRSVAAEGPGTEAGLPRRWPRSGRDSRPLQRGEPHLPRLRTRNSGNQAGGRGTRLDDTCISVPPAKAPGPPPWRPAAWAHRASPPNRRKAPRHRPCDAQAYQRIQHPVSLRTGTAT